MVTATSAVALNVGIVRATSESDVGSDETVALASDGSPLVVTLNADVIDDPTSTTEGAEPVAAAPAAAPAPAAPASTAAAPSSTTSNTSAAPATAAPSSSAAAPAEPAEQAQPSTTYHTFQAGGAGEVVIANHGNTLEFWAAYPNGGWEYGVEKSTGREITVKFRGNGELEWKAKLDGGNIKIESEQEEDDD